LRPERGGFNEEASNAMERRTSRSDAFDPFGRKPDATHDVGDQDMYHIISYVRERER
jgi:hypothetical protein